jgi:ketosteroid isomerase-like protein
MANQMTDIVLRFNDALNARDLEAMMALQTADCVFENTNPAPDGTRYQGQASVHSFWEEFFRSSAESHFDVEEIFALDDHVVMRWIYRWRDEQGSEGHIRGVDLYRIIDGLIAEKLSYVKG